MPVRHLLTMGSLSNLSIVSGAVPVVLDVLGVAALGWLVIGNRRHLSKWVPAAAACSAVLTTLFWYLSEKVWNLWGAPLPASIYVFTGLSVLAVLLVAPKIFAARRLWARIVALPMAAVVVLAAVSLVNQGFEYYPTLGSVFGDAGVTIQTLQQFRGRAAVPMLTSTTSTLESTWEPPVQMPPAGMVLKVNIPGTISHEISSPAYVYLPPAYLATPRANLPVLVLIHGVPGTSMDWLLGGRIDQFMNSYAAGHKGLAPIVVMPDAGGRYAKYPPLCMNSKEGQGATYLARDVPNWIKKTFGAGTTSARQWAIGGFSYGGTCAMQLAMNYPKVYPTFIDSSGENEPTITQGHTALLQRYFAGSAAAYAKQNALDVMKTRKYPGTEGIITVGASDSYYRPQGEQVYAAMRKDGIHVRLELAPGGHAWPAWSYGVYNNMGWLMTRLGVGS